MRARLELTLYDGVHYMFSDCTRVWNSDTAKTNVYQWLSVQSCLFHEEEKRLRGSPVKIRIIQKPTVKMSGLRDNCDLNERTIHI